MTLLERLLNDATTILTNIFTKECILSFLLYRREREE